MNDWNDKRLMQAYLLIEDVLRDVKAGDPMEETVEHLDSVLESIETVDEDMSGGAA